MCHAPHFVIAAGVQQEIKVKTESNRFITSGQLRDRSNRRFHLLKSAKVNQLKQEDFYEETLLFGYFASSN